MQQPCSHCARGPASLHEARQGTSGPPPVLALITVWTTFEPNVTHHARIGIVTFSACDRAIAQSRMMQLPGNANSIGLTGRPSRKRLPTLVKATKDSIAANDRLAIRTALNDFTRWAIDQKITFDAVRADQIKGSRGLFATYPNSKGQPLCSVPSSCAITLRPSEAPAAGLPAQLWQDLPWWCQLAVKVAVLERRYDGYKAVLPQRVDLPALWQQQGSSGGMDPVQELQLPYTINKVRGEQQQWATLVSRLQPLLARQGVTEERLQWALSIVRSRSFAGPTFLVPTAVKKGLAAVLFVGAVAAGVAGGQEVGPGLLLPALALMTVPAGLCAWDLQQAPSKVTYAIAPFLDMLNHSSEAGTEVAYDWVREAYSVSAGRAYSQGAEVHISYGELSNDALLQLYGFVQEDNPHDRYVMADLASRLAEGPLLQQASGGGSSAQQLASALSQANRSGLLTEVELRPQVGFPPEVQVAVTTLAAQVLQAGGSGAQGDGASSSGSGSGSSGSSSSGSGMSAAALAKAALRHACEAELSALGSSLDDDTQQLGRLRRLALLATQPAPVAPQPPTPPVPPSLPVAALDVSMVGSAGVVTSAGQPVELGAVQGQGQAVLVASAEEVAERARYEQQMQQYSVQQQQYSVQQQHYERQVVEHEVEMAGWQEARAMGQVGADRLCNAVAYRIEKKKVLVSCKIRTL